MQDNDPAASWTQPPPPHTGTYPWSPTPPPQWPAPAPAAPHRRAPGYWYAIGAALIAVGLIGGIGLFVTGLVYALTGPTSQFDANGSATAQFASGDSMIIYIADVELVPKLTQNIRCVARDENNNDATVSRYDGSLSINQWHALYVVRAHQAGNYTVSCAGYSDITYGLGPRAGTGAITATFAGPIAGLTLAGGGIIVLIITASRRRKATPQHPYGNPYPYPPGPR